MNQIATLVFSLCLLASASHASNSSKYWITFTDKGFTSKEITPAIEKLRASCPERSIVRRLKQDINFSVSDLPVNPKYIRQLNQLGIEVIEQSRWLNAASAHLSESELILVNKLEYVHNINPVGSIAPRDYTGHSDFEYSTVEINNLLRTQQMAGVPLNAYGLSFWQSHQAGVISAHQAGWTGEGVFLGALDTGFEFGHVAMAGVRLLAQYDFINNDDDTSWEPLTDRFGQSNHGTACLSVIVGYNPGILTGIAPRVDVAVAKTEETGSETPIEEDYWIAGLEWLEWLGVEVVTSSLSYRDWYYDDDYTGFISPASRAAQRASELGMIICNSAGNNGPDDVTLGAPSDAPDVLAIAAVDSLGVVTGFSSRGPSSMGNIKPDLSAMGRNVACISPRTIDKYAHWSGTSLSCPIVAGVAALIIEAHPNWRADFVREAMRQTADRSFMPDMTYGYGIVNAKDAIDYPFLEGKILSLTNQPIGEIAINLLNDQMELEVVSTQNGYYRFVNLPEGSYELSAIWKDDVYRLTDSISLPPTAIFDIQLP